MNLERLKDPFPASSIEWRVGQAGAGPRGPWAMVLAYVSARAAQDRLDEVVGPENWKAEYHFIQNGAVCRLSIRINNEWVTKEDVSEFTDIEALKGGVSGAFKRAASAWGIARYLYDLTENFAKIVDKGTPEARYAKAKDGSPFYWVPPTLPDWALPESERSKSKTTTTKAVESVAATIKVSVPENVEIASPLNENFITPPVTVKPSGFKKVSKAPAAQQGEGQW